MTENIKCPFCNEDDFDLIGLKNHFEKGHCEIYNKTQIVYPNRDSNWLDIPCLICGVPARDHNSHFCTEKLLNK